MVGLTLVDTAVTLQAGVRSVAGLSAISSPSSTQVTAKAATDTSLSAALRQSVTTLDPLALGAVIGAANGFAPGGDAQEHSLILNQLLGGLTDTLSKGQGGYFISYQDAQGGGFAASVTADEFTAFVGGKDDGSYNGVSLGAAVRSALADASRSAGAASRLQPAAIEDPTVADEQTALTLITRNQESGVPQAKLKTNEATQGASQTRLLIDNKPAPDGTGTNTVTIAYIPPSETSTTTEGVTEAVQTVATVDVVA